MTDSTFYLSYFYTYKVNIEEPTHLFETHLLPLIFVNWTYQMVLMTRPSMRYNYQSIQRIINTKICLPHN